MSATSIASRGIVGGIGTTRITITSTFGVDADLVSAEAMINGSGFGSSLKMGIRIFFGAEGNLSPREGVSTRMTFLDELRTTRSDILPNSSLKKVSLLATITTASAFTSSDF